MSKEQAQSGVSGAQKKPRVWPVYVLFLVALFATSLATVLLVGAAFAMDHPGASPTRERLMQQALLPSTFTWTIVFSAVLLSGLSFGAAALSKERFVERLSISAGRIRPLQVVVAMLGLPALGMVMENITLLLGVEIDGTLEMIAHSIGSAHGLQSVAIVAAISLGPGIGEELLFRGYIQTRLLKRHGPAVAIIVSSLLFGLMHMDPLQSTLTVFLGVYLGFIAYRFGTIWPAIAAHALNNGASALALTLFPDEPTPTGPSWASLVVGAVVFATCFGFVLRKVPAE